MRDLSGSQLIAAPRGLEEIVVSFGDIYKYIQPGGSLDPRWQADFLASVDLPFSLPLAWDPLLRVNRMTCHKRMVEIFASVFDRLQARGLQSKIVSFGGCFAFRQQRRGTKLSTHSWGIAIDLNTATNPQGSAGDMDAGVIEIFRGAGFEWGGDWPGKLRDGMHFQFCSGY
jgi:D-alanyl-D-alanine carboxypeptidase